VDKNAEKAVCRHCILSAELTKAVRLFFFGDFVYWDSLINKARTSTVFFL